MDSRVETHVASVLEYPSSRDKWVQTPSAKVIARAGHKQRVWGNSRNKSTTNVDQAGSELDSPA